MQMQWFGHRSVKSCLYLYFNMHRPSINIGSPSALARSARNQEIGGYIISQPIPPFPPSNVINIHVNVTQANLQNNRHPQNSRSTHNPRHTRRLRSPRPSTTMRRRGGRRSRFKSRRKIRFHIPIQTTVPRRNDSVFPLTRD